jgi:UDP-N-acetylmuramyl pentapeptide synthase
MFLLGLMASAKHRRRRIRELMKTPIGRRRILRGIVLRFLVLLWPIVETLRRTALYRAKVIAVVGSYGKTTTTRAVMAALGLPAERHVGWNAGVSLLANLLRGGITAAYRVIEVGIRAPGDMVRAASRVRPDIVVVTCVGSEHHLSFGTLERTRQEKAAMLRILPEDGLAVLNGDDPNVLWMGGETTARKVLYGFDAHNDVRATDVVLDSRPGMSLTVHVGNAERRIAVCLIGRHMVYSVLAAVAVAREVGIRLDDALQRIAELPPASERLEPVRMDDGTLLLLDSFKSALETIEVGIDVLKEFPAKRRIAVLGDIEEPPGPQGSLYKDLGRRLAGVADRVVYIGGKKAFASLRGGARDAGRAGDSFVYAGRRPMDAVPQLTSVLGDGTVIWIKGRSNQHLGRIGWALAGRDVRCSVTSCPVSPGCASCPMLEHRSHRFLFWCRDRRS